MIVWAIKSNIRQYERGGGFVFGAYTNELYEAILYKTEEQAQKRIESTPLYLRSCKPVKIEIKEIN